MSLRNISVLQFCIESKERIHVSLSLILQWHFLIFAVCFFYLVLTVLSVKEEISNVHIIWEEVFCYSLLEIKPTFNLILNYLTHMMKLSCINKLILNNDITSFTICSICKNGNNNKRTIRKQCV